ncbi:S24/S26 family peptidase [Curvivirga sp.]|uniref:S24/S26 family peptidase n=1 Tax=Curvivirga sp. TaxID=2856848 RepID=UPI003B5A2661
MFGWRLLKINGHSMSPSLENGDYAIMRVAVFPSRLHAKLKEGDIVFFKRRDENAMVKRLTKKQPNGDFNIMGDGPLSAPSIDLGLLSPKDIKGKLFFRIHESKISKLK